MKRTTTVITEPAEQQVSSEKDVELLAGVASALSGVFELDSLLRAALDKLLELFEADKGAIHLLDEGPDHLVLSAHRGFSPEYVRKYARLKRGQQVAGQVALSGQAILLDDSLGQRSARGMVGRERFRSLLCAPLLSNGDVLGTVTLLGMQPNLFDQAGMQLIDFMARHISAGVTSARLVQEQENRVSELAALNEIGQAIVSTLDLVEVLKLVAQKTAQICQVERCSIMLLDETGETLVPMMSQYASGAADEELWKAFKSRSLSQRVDQLPIVEDVIRDGKTVVLHGDSVYSLPAVWAERFGVKSVLLVPLEGREAIIGLMALDYSTEGRQFTAQQVNLATMIGSQVAMAIQNARLFARQEHRAVQLSVINQVGRRATSSLDLDVLLQETAAAVQEAFRYDFVSILVKSEEQAEIVQRAEVGLDSHMLVPDYRQSVDEGLIGWAVRSGEPVVANDVGQDDRYLEGFPARPFTKSELVVPIKVGSQVVAALDIQSREPNTFDQADLMAAQAIADQLSVSMRNSHLYEQSRTHLRKLEAANKQLVALQQTGAALASTLDLQQVLQGVVDGVVHGLGYSVAAIGVVDRSEMVVENILVSGLTGAQLREIERISGGQLPGLRLPLGAGDGLVAKALSERKILVTDRLHELFRSLLNETLSEVAQELVGFKTIITVPLTIEDRPLGALCAATERSQVGKEELASLRALGNQAGLAIENARLYERTIARLDELSALHQISMTSTSTLDLPGILEPIAEALQDMVPLSNLAIMLFDERDKRLKITAGSGYTSDLVHTIQPGMGEGITGWVAMTGVPLNVPDVTVDPRYIMGDEAVRSEACVPLSVGNRIIGVLNVESRQLAAFSEDTVRFLSTLSGQLAVTIENARLFQKVAQGEKDWEDTFRAITDGIAIYGEDLTILRANPALADLLETPLESLLGKHCYEVFTYCAGPANPSCPHRQTLQKGEPTSIEVEEPTLRKTLQITSFPILGQDGASKGTVHAVRDVSEEKALRAQLLQTEKLAAIGELVSGVAHELNNPLTSVMGYSQLLLASDVEPEIKEDLRTIHHEAERSAKIIENLLTFARKESAEKRYTDINRILRDTIELRSYQLRVDNVELLAELEENLPWTMAAPHQLQQVFLNLVNNAHQALMETAGNRRLAIHSAKVGDVIQIKVVDNGPGIPEEHLSKIFDPFFTTKDVGEGTGLGLSIAFGIVQEHGGRIWAENIPEAGTVFTVELPIVSYPLEDSSPSMLDEDVNRGEGHTILVIDDEAEILGVMTRIIEHIGHRAVALTSAEEALAELSRRQYDLVVCDIKMPGIGGQGFYRKVKEAYPQLAKRIIFTTGDTLSETARAFLENTEAHCVSKPFAIDDLQRAIDALI
jgi:two-component system NtrC family sensor kinase